MVDLQSKPLIELNLDTREITITNNIKYIDIDKNTANIFLQIYREDNTGLKTYLTKEELDSFVGKMFLIKPVTNDFTEITGVTTEEFKSDNGGGVLRFIIPTKCTNRNGIVKCEIHVNKDSELLASDRFVYNVKQSLVTQFNDSLLEDSDFPILQQLILEIQKDSNIDDNNISKVTSYSSDKVENIKEDLSSQIKEKASKQELEIERKRIDSFTRLSEGSTTGDAELMDARIGADGANYVNLGTSIRTQFSKLNDCFDTVIGINRFDGVFDESGYIDSKGQPVDSSRFKRTSKYYSFSLITTYLYILLSETTTTFVLAYYSDDNTFLGVSNCNNLTFRPVQPPTNATKFKVYTENTFNGTVCISNVQTDIHIQYEEKKFINASNKDESITYNMLSDEVKNIINKVENKVIVNFGDSIFGNFRDETSISSQLAKLSGYTVYNCGFGGCRIAKRNSASTQTETSIAWDSYGMVEIVDAIISKDFSKQEANLNYGTTPGNTIPAYLKEPLNTLKAIDFFLFFIITIEY